MLLGSSLGHFGLSMSQRRDCDKSVALEICSDCNVIRPQMCPECWRQTRRGKRLVQTTRRTQWVSWTLSQLCHIVSMWTHCLRHQLVASTFAVSAGVRRTFLLPSCSRTLCDSTSGLSTVNIFWLCPDAFVKRPTATTHSAFLLKFYWFFFIFIFFPPLSRTILVVQFLCMYILKKGVNIERTNQGCLQCILQEQASWLLLSIHLNCTGINCYICIHCIFSFLFFFLFCLTFIVSRFYDFICCSYKGFDSRKVNKVFTQFYVCLFSPEMLSSN